MTISYRNYELRAESESAEEFSCSTSVYARFGKRILDVLVVLFALPAILPIVAFFAFIVMLDGHNPFYFQNRIGKDNRMFRMWKLRSMVPNAKEHLTQYLDNHPTARAEWDEKQKLKDDPRVTAIGRFIRKFSIDELPQLWNVLRGDMSIVGPRPMMPSQRSLYPGMAYYRMRPGITGLWQISGRSESTFAARASFDDEYESVMTAKTDVSVMLSTVGVVVKGTGC